MSTTSSLAAARKAGLLLAVLTVLATGAPPPARADDAAGPFANLSGWWGGEGRLRFKDGKQEAVKCRATYFVEQAGQQLKQTVRCASGSGKIEVTSSVTHDAGKLTGSWNEHIYNLEGELNGEVTARGYRVSVKGTGAGLSANMEILVRDNKQIIEIQFFGDALIGLTLMLQKG